MSRYNKLSKVSESDFSEMTWTRQGLSETEWKKLTPEERVIHYNRNSACEHKANLHDWPPDLREAYSFDPYFHTPHMEPCQRPALSIDECPCQMCSLKIGIER